MMHLVLCINSTCKGLAAAIDTLVFTEDRNGATCALKVPHFASRSIVHHFTAGVNQRHCKFVAASAHCFFKEYTCMYVCVCIRMWVFLQSLLSCSAPCARFLPSRLTRLTNSLAIIYRSARPKSRDVLTTWLDCNCHGACMNEWMK